LFVLQNHDLMQQISTSIETHSRKPSKTGV